MSFPELHYWQKWLSHVVFCDTVGLNKLYAIPRTPAKWTAPARLVSHCPREFSGKLRRRTLQSVDGKAQHSTARICLPRATPPAVYFPKLSYWRRFCRFVFYPAVKLASLYKTVRRQLETASVPQEPSPHARMIFRGRSGNASCSQRTVQCSTVQQVQNTLYCGR